jgi:N-acyl-D-aspartate/D-glutamate deacylase
MLDYAIVGGVVIDGTGGPGRRADVGIKDGRIVVVGEMDEQATTTLDATDLIVTPGFVDAHTHYDAQLWWDPTAAPSNWHGVTTVIGGNCGFGLAPLKAPDADYTRRMMAQVEGIPLKALEEGVPWNWESFGEFLDGLENGLAINAGFLVGHCALRRFVLGSDFKRESTPREVEQLVALLDQSLADGGLGLSTSRSSTEVDGDGDPVPSRWASEAEVLALCAVLGEHDGTGLEANMQGCLRRFADDEVELLAQMSATAHRPLNWNVLGVEAADPEKVPWQMRPSRRARELGGRVVALTMPIFADNNQSFKTFCAIWLLPGWRTVLDQPSDRVIAELRDPATRARLLASARDSNMPAMAEFERYLIGEVYSTTNEQYRNRLVGDIAREKGQDPFEAIVEIVAADDLRTVLWPQPGSDGPEDWELRRTLWEDPDVVLGGSDAGAHLDRMLGSAYPTRFLSDSLRGKQLVSLERAVQMMTDVPARLFGLRGRGRVAEGCHADLTVLDSATVDATPVRTAFDLPGDAKRLLADPIGVVRVLVNGHETIVDGAPVGSLPGTLLRSGRDTGDTDTRTM